MLLQSIFVSIEGKGQQYFQNVPTFAPEHFLLCQTASLPADLGNIPVSFMGRQIKLPGTRTFGNLSLSFYNDEDMSIRVPFEEWPHDIQNFANVFGNKVEINADSRSSPLYTLHNLERRVTNLEGISSIPLSCKRRRYRSVIRRHRYH